MTSRISDACGEIEHVLNYTVAVDIRGITLCLLAVAHVARSAALIVAAMHLSAWCANEITRVTSFTESILSMCSGSAGRGSANTIVRFRPEERVRKCKPLGAHVRLTYGSPLTARDKSPSRFLKPTRSANYFRVGVAGETIT